MGTLGCINDMLQRDKENRALRKLSRGRMREHYKYLVERKSPERADVTIEEIEKIRRNTTEKELSDKETFDNTQFIRNIAGSFFIVIFVTV